MISILLIGGLAVLVAISIAAAVAPPTGSPRDDDSDGVL
jgi:hypothetical protein